MSEEREDDAVYFVHEGKKAGVLPDFGKLLALILWRCANVLSNAWLVYKRSELHDVVLSVQFDIHR